MHEFYKRVDLLLKEKKETKASICRATGVPFSSLNNYWNGDRLPQGYVIEKFCVFLETSADYLIFGAETGRRANMVINEINSMLAEMDNNELHAALGVFQTIVQIQPKALVDAENERVENEVLEDERRSRLKKV